jgi:YaiO family outer membrane protein
MLVFLLSVTLLAASSAQLATPPPPTFAEAEQLANEGRDGDALAAFQRIASINPNDHEARLWIARLHERMGHPDLAEAVYRSVLLEDPGNIEAMIGVGVTLLARHETEDAIEVLERAEELQPQREVILIALGEAHREEGDAERAISYLERAFELAPTEQHRLQLESAQRSYLHRAELRGVTEDFNGNIARTSNAAVLVNYRLRDRLRVFGRADWQRKFGVSEERGGGGLEWRWKPATILMGHALVGPDNRVMSEGDYMGGINHTYERASWTGTYRYFDFTGAAVTMLSPSVDWQYSPLISLGLGYSMSFTETNVTPGITFGHSGYIRGAYQLYPRIAITAGYAGGVSDLETFSIDEIGRFNAHALSGGVRWDLPTLTSVIGSYEYQWRANDVRRQRVMISLGQRFRSFRP